MATMMHFLKYLWANSVKFRVVGRIPAFLSQDIDSATHIPSRICAKTILMKADGQHWMVVVPADDSVDKQKLQKTLQVKHIDIVTEKDFESIIPDCDAEAIPPFGNVYGLSTIVDKSIAGKEEIAFNAISNTDFIVMKFKDYERLARPLIAEFAVSKLSERGRPAVRSISSAINKHAAIL